jgi:phage terminase small subunit
MRSDYTQPRNALGKKVFAEAREAYNLGRPYKNPQSLLQYMTEFQRNFVIEYLDSLDGTKSVVNAGSKSEHPAQIAHQLLKNENIVLAIELIQGERARKSQITKDVVIKRVMKIIDDCEKDDTYNPNAALRGLELIARHLGMFVEKHEISGKDGEAIKYEKVEEDAQKLDDAINSLVERSKHPLKIVGGKDA